MRGRKSRTCRFWLAVAALAGTVPLGGCAHPAADDWHKFQADTAPMHRQMQRVTSAWQQLDSVTASLKPPQRYTATLAALDGSILPALKSALANLDKAHPRTPEVQNVQTRYGEALARLEISARELRAGNAALQKGNVRDGNPRLADSREELHRALDAFKEATNGAAALDQRYGSGRP